MAQQPVFLLHIAAGFHIDVTAAGKRSNKQICFVFIACSSIVIRNRFACPVYLHCVARLVRDAHGRFRYTSPTAVLVAELRAHVRLLTVCTAIIAVFLPQQRERYTFL